MKKCLQTLLCHFVPSHPCLASVHRALNVQFLLLSFCGKFCPDFIPDHFSAPSDSVQNWAASVNNIKPFWLKIPKKHPVLCALWLAFLSLESGKMVHLVPAEQILIEGKLRDKHTLTLKGRSHVEMAYITTWNSLDLLGLTSKWQSSELDWGQPVYPAKQLRRTAEHTLL